MLRNAAAKESPLGKKAKGYMTRGELVPDELVIDIVKERLMKSDVARGFILDGFPRTIEQAKILDAVLSRIKKKLDMALYFETSIEMSISRLSGRRVCGACGANFHVINIPPKKIGVCDHCGRALCQRKDDSEETVRRRWSVYTEETTPLVDYYEESGILEKVSGDLDVNELNIVLKALFRGLEKHRAKPLKPKHGSIGSASCGKNLA